MTEVNVSYHYPNGGTRATYRLAASIKAIVDSRSGSAVASEVTSVDETPEGDVTARRGQGAAASIGRTLRVVPLVTGRLLALVKRGIGVQGVRIGTRECSSLGHVERVAVRRNTEDNLVGRHSCGRPSSDRTGRATVLSWRACISKRCVRANGVAPASPDVVVHDLDPVKRLGETRDVSEWGAIGTLPGEYRSSGGEDELLPDRILTELLKEGKEVGGVVRREDVATDTLRVRIFPTV